MDMSHTAAHDQQSRGPQTVIISIVFTAIAGIAVILRLITRLHIVKNFGAEDGFIVASYILSVALAVLIGIGKPSHLFDEPLSVD